MRAATAKTAVGGRRSPARRNRPGLSASFLGATSEVWHRRTWAARVLHLRDAFVVQMNDFDSVLERELRLMLDVVVASPAPARRGVPESGASFLTVAPLPVELAAATIAVVGPTVATMPDRPVPPFS
jgi:hypothetical protein